MLRRFFAAERESDSRDPWPVYPETIGHEPKFLFILTAPCSGSTLLARVLNTAPNSMLLHPAGEGLWLVPGTKNASYRRRWDPEFDINWQSVRSVWLRRVEFVEKLVGQIDVVIEKSPIMLMRSEEIRTTFPRSAFAVLTRDPLASCSSFFHRYNESAEQDSTVRSQEFRILADAWVARHRMLRQAADSLDLPVIRYEDLCLDPANSLQPLIERVPEMSGINPDAEFKIKDYPSQGISNQNARQKKWLQDADRKGIQSVLCKEHELLEYFGYRHVFDETG